MTAVDERIAPGVHDIDENTYHRGPLAAMTLSSSGAKKLLPPSCPALFKWWRDNGQAPKKEFDFGHAAHRIVLGSGAEILTVPADDWRTKAAKEAAERAREQGAVPLLEKDFRVVEAMAKEIADHPVAAALFRDGQPEQSLFWVDDETGVTRRGRLDWLPDPRNGRLILADYKTAASANPAKFGRAAADYGYHQQAAWYLDGVKALGLADSAAFVFVVQEKTAPYLVTVIELDAQALRIGRALNREAIDLYARCVTDDDWPGYSIDVEPVSLPHYYTRDFEDSL